MIRAHTSKILWTCLVVMSCVGEAFSQEIKDDYEPPQSVRPDSLPSNAVFKIAEQMPRFPGCEGLEGTDDEISDCAHVKMLTYLYTNVRYPREAVKKGVEGRTVIQFIVETDGTLTNIACVQGLGHGIDEESLRVIESMNYMSEKWIPGKQNGKPVRVLYTIPVNFKL